MNTTCRPFWPNHSSSASGRTALNARHSAILLAAGFMAWALPAAYAATEVRVPTGRFAHHELSGFAILGFDPVAYFADGTAKAGRDLHELKWGEAAWRFVSKANAEAFKSNPDVYAPQFGGYDADAMARGVAVAADPAVFLVMNNRLYLFRTPASRDAFARAPERLLAAQHAWQNIKL